MFSIVVLCLEVNCLRLQLLINNGGKKSRVCELQKIKDSRIKDSLEMIREIRTAIPANLPRVDNSVLSSNLMTSPTNWLILYSVF